MYIDFDEWFKSISEGEESLSNLSPDEIYDLMERAYKMGQKNPPIDDLQ